MFNNGLLLFVGFGIIFQHLCDGMDISEIPQPDGFIITTFSNIADTGTFQSHPGFPSAPYQAGQNTRFIIAAAEGQLVKLTIDVTQASQFFIRRYDFAVMLDGLYATRMDTPCNVSSYRALGLKDLDYQSVVMAEISNARTYTSITNILVVDFCVNNFTADVDAMKGFQASWQLVQPTAIRGVTPAGDKCGQPLVSPAAQRQNTVRIVGGVPAVSKSWPSIGALVYQGKQQFCAGTILSNQWVVTAGHCVIFDNATFASSVQFFYGSQNNNLSLSQSVPIAYIAQHERYNVPSSGLPAFDVAIIKLARPITFSDSVQPMCLPSSAANATKTPITGSNNRPITYVAGYGLLSETQKAFPNANQPGSGSNSLMQTTVELYSNVADCKAAYPTLPSTAICAGIKAGGQDACQGDSGGPLILQLMDQSYVLIGVVSAGTGCARAQYPGVYTDVFAMIPWIKSKIGWTSTAG
ncbi:acrosin-like isoform X2 [Paramacrobiotus metropolitanus]|uniref:acrosin-like isoform X2 n=1 Tax=Paramacrobiotus metropolitanus TaxID=2943436 RepID=UPI0024463536|nr:acrosin-like isoform X2 [Paramacrobiotus metropolitanus]